MSVSDSMIALRTVQKYDNAIAHETRPPFGTGGKMFHSMHTVFTAFNSVI